METYRSHKTVKAAEIEKVEAAPIGFLIFLRDEEAGRELDPKMFTWYVPVAGDFLVEYEDGYQSFSPRKNFLDGYTKVEQ